MKLHELVQQLSSLDSEMEVLLYTEDPQLMGVNKTPRVLEIEDISTRKLLAKRVDTGEALIKFSDERDARPYVTIEVTADI